MQAPPAHFPDIKMRPAAFNCKRPDAALYTINAGEGLRKYEEMTSTTLQDLAESFSLFDNWEDRYRYIIELGQRLEPMDEALKTDAHMVRGCTSRVWLVAVQRDGRWHFLADSDAQIVRGLIHILMIAYQDKTPEEIKDVDIEKSFESLGLSGHLSPSRRNGFFAMVERIKALAH